MVGQPPSLEFESVSFDFMAIYSFVVRLVQNIRMLCARKPKKASRFRSRVLRDLVGLWTLLPGTGIHYPVCVAV